MRYLVLGGTGFMGAPLVHALVEEGADVAVLSRGERAASLPPEVLRLEGDRFDLEPVARNIESFAPDVVIDMLAMSAEKDGPVLSFFGERCRRYVLISSCDVYRVMGRLWQTEPGPVIGGLQSEEAPLRESLYPFRKLLPDQANSTYDKIPLEKAVLNDFAFRGTVLRLPMVYGPGDRQHRWRDVAAHIEWDRPALLMPDVSAAWISSYGYIDNVVAAIVAAALSEDAAGEIFNVADVNTLTQRDWVEAFGHIAGWEGKVVTAPAETLPEARAKRADGGNWAQNLQIDASKITRVLGFERPVSLTESLTRTLEYECESLEDLPADAFDFAADDRWLAERD